MAAADAAHPYPGEDETDRRRPASAPSELVIAPMTLGDLDEVMQIEQRSFLTPWSRRAFVIELTENTWADYIVARCAGQLVGYGGMWLILDEAHVTNIAVHPDWRGRKVGQAILVALIDRARLRRARRMTLEVRPSNLVAQRLYEKFGFAAVGRRPGYYTDTREDAIIMWRDPL